jgi:archaeal preflagellin peptidase FlaK
MAGSAALANLDPTGLVASLAPHSMTLRFVGGGLILLYAIGWDLWARRVPNPVWLAPIGLGLILLGYDFAAGTPQPGWILGIPAVMLGAYLLWRMRLLFGGADAKCIMAFAVLAPFPPALHTAAGAYPHFVAFTPTAVTMLTNAVLLTILVPVFFFLTNLLKGNIHPVAMFLGTRVPLKRAQEDPVWVMQWVELPASEGDVGPSLEETSEDPSLVDDELPDVPAEEVAGGRLRFVYFPTRAPGYARNIARLKAMGVRDVWVTPKVPFMVPLFLGFITAWLFGDLIMTGVLWATGRL